MSGAHDVEMAVEGAEAADVLDDLRALGYAPGAQTRILAQALGGAIAVAGASVDERLELHKLAMEAEFQAARQALAELAAADAAGRH